MNNKEPIPERAPDSEKLLWDRICEIENARADTARKEQFSDLNHPWSKLGLFAVSTCTANGGLDPESISSELQAWLELVVRFDELRAQASSMGERLEIALMPEYYGKIGIVELGLSRYPDKSEEVLRMQSEYQDLLRWYEEQNNPLTVMGPSSTNTLIEFWPTDITDKVMVVKYSQRVARGTVPTLDAGKAARIQIVHTQWFGVRTDVLRAFEERYGARCFWEESNPRQMEAIETLVQNMQAPRNAKKLSFRIREAYLLETYAKSAD